ncbi:hypothetical protein QJS10_CPA02g01542 [Acorus calamus]|uniref:Exocyst subunit Exo70 family protein n=1 Tax=Acorus calamus TaxID=4465 RepID=A0AAV9FD48_ACOCL|nr:hypothetical protein QJS10_CPA02g01542 [Acorus calamus]
MDLGNLEPLVTARKSLRASLEKSKALAAALDRAGPRLDEIHHRLPSLEAAVRPIRASKDALLSVGGHIDRAVGPAAAVLRVFDAVHGLERPLLSDQIRSDLAGYLSVLKRLEEALRFLSDNCGLAVQWLDDIVEYLEENSVADARFVAELKKSLNLLHESRASEDAQSCVDGGLLIASLERLESEFRRLLEENSVPLSMSPSQPSDQHRIIAPSLIPTNIIQKLLLILERATANGRLERCVSIYVDVRTINVRASLKDLDLVYLEMTAADIDSVRSVETHIERWGRHLEFAVKHLFEAEYKLCSDVFDNNNVRSECFARVAANAGILAFLKFGMTVTETKNDPIKLLKLLDIFRSLNKLRLDFNRLFGGKACLEIQNLTRDLIKKVIEGACEIFWELLVQVELQRQMPPPADGAVPRLVSFISDYCNRLIGDDYRPVLLQVLVIHRSWKQERFQERLLIDAVLNIIRALEQNFEVWSKGYDDQVLAYLFMMNMHHHFCKALKGTRLGELLGEVWLKEHEQYKEYYMAMYLKESWGKLPALLSREGLIMFSVGRATARDSVKKRLRGFNEAFDEMYKRQTNWVVSDKDLRERMCQLTVQAIVPVYRSYMQSYGPLVEQDASSAKYAKYTVQALEKMLGSLFQVKPGRSASFTSPRQSNGKFGSGVVSPSKYSTSPTVV